MSLHFNPNSRVIRETTVKDFEYDDNGERKLAEIVVRYYSPTPKETQEKHEAIKAKLLANPDSVVNMIVEDLLGLVHSTSLVNEKEVPYEITAEFLGGLTGHNLRAIQRAITDDVRPK